MHKLFTFLESDENFARVVRWANFVNGTVAVSVLGVFLISYLNR
ncbi:hypothetical protein PQQ86_08460 [Paraburkholderia sediminicola]|jgi:hypothetical protein